MLMFLLHLQCIVMLMWSVLMVTHDISIVVFFIAARSIQNSEFAKYPCGKI